MGNRVLANSAPIYVKNEAGEEIPAYGCMKVTGAAELDGQNYLEVEKPDSDFDATFLINGPHAIEDGGRGVAQTSNVLRILTDGGTITNGQQWGPVDGEWHIDSAASTKLFRAIGGDDVADNVGRFVLLDSGDLKLFRFTLNEDMGATTANKGDADILQMDGTDTGIDADVEDPLAIFATLESGDPGLCLKQGGSYYIIQAPCPA